MSYDHENPMKMTEEKSTVNINIHGGNNQILPNATHAEQHFHYHTTAVAELPSSTHIYNNVEIDSDYIDKLRRCCTASDLAKVVVEMVHDESIPYLDSVLAVKAEFFTRLLPFCPNLKKGISESNLRAQINNELATKPKIPYGQQY